MIWHDAQAGEHIALKVWEAHCSEFYTLVQLALIRACFSIWDLHCRHELVDISWQVMGLNHFQNQTNPCISIAWWCKYTLVSSEDLRAQACSSVSTSGPAVNIFVLEIKWGSNNTSFTKKQLNIKGHRWVIPSIFTFAIRCISLPAPVAMLHDVPQKPFKLSGIGVPSRVYLALPRKHASKWSANST